MAKKFVLVLGLHNVFESVSDLNNCSVCLNSSLIVDENSILYITADSSDSSIFSNYKVHIGDNLIYAKGKLFGNYLGDSLKCITNNSSTITINDNYDVWFINTSYGGSVNLVFDMGDLTANLDKSLNIMAIIKNVNTEPANISLGADDRFNVVNNLYQSNNFVLDPSNFAEIYYNEIKNGNGLSYLSYGVNIPEIGHLYNIEINISTNQSIEEILTLLFNELTDFTESGVYHINVNFILTDINSQESIIYIHTGMTLYVNNVHNDNGDNIIFQCAYFMRFGIGMPLQLFIFAERIRMTDGTWTEVSFKYLNEYENKIENITIEGTTLSISSKSVDIPLSSGNSAGVVKTTSTVSSSSGLNPVPIIDGIPYYKGLSVVTHGSGSVLTSLSVSDHTIDVSLDDISGATDIKVKQTSSSSTNTFPMLASNQSSPTSGTAYESVYNSNIKIKPSDGQIIANQYKVTTTSSTLSCVMYYDSTDRCVKFSFN